MKVFTFIFFLYLSTPGFCQSGDSLKSIYSGSITFGGFYQSGNTSKFYIQSKGDIKRASKTLETILAGTFGYGENKMKKDENIFSSVLTVDLFYRNKLSPFLLQIAEYNFAKGIDIRSQSGGGIKYVVIPDLQHKSSLSLALIYDYTNLVNKPGNYTSEAMRFSLRVKSRQVLLDSHLILSAVGFYQPAVNDLSKKNIRIETILDIPVTKIIFANINYIYTFDDIVSVGRRRADNKFTFGLKAGFGE